MKSSTIGLIIVLLVLIAALVFLVTDLTEIEPEINSFEACVKAGNPVMESYPPQCAVPGGSTFTEDSCRYTKGEDIFILTISDAKSIAIDTECGDNLKENYFCNENTGTYWIDLDIEKEGCNPACVINLETREAEINWRCTGLIS